MLKSSVASQASPATSHPAALHARWMRGQQIVNLRGQPDDPAWRQAVAQVTGLNLPETHLSVVGDDDNRIVPAGPDDWFWARRGDSAARMMKALREATVGQHVAFTDVSGGYTVLQLRGPQARPMLAQGCPLDLHPRAFTPGQCAGSVFFKSSVWLWQIDAEPTYQLLVRRSFEGYVRTLLRSLSQEHALDMKDLA